MKNIKIIVNGQEENCPANSSIESYLESKGVQSNQVVAEHNGNIIKPEDFAQTKLQDGDKVEFIRFVGGG